MKKNESPSFDPAHFLEGVEPFKPAWWCPGPHVQTLWRSLFEIPRPLPVERVRWTTPDGDFIDLDFLKIDRVRDKPPLVLLLHGLEGSSRSNYIQGLLRECYHKNWLGIAMNFRSCSGEINRRVRSYHSGETGDLNWVVQQLIALYPGHSIAIAGYSMGGNVLLKWLGENGQRLPVEVVAGAAISVPFDLKLSAALIDKPGFNRAVYASLFLKTLKEKTIRKIKKFNLPMETDRIRKIQTFHEYDNMVTAPFHGFRDAEEYWFLSSSLRYLDKIQTPVYLLNALDDPFYTGTSLHFDEIQKNDFLEEEMPPYGGHVGFVRGKWPWKASYLPDQRIVDYFSKKLGGSS